MNKGILFDERIKCNMVKVVNKEKLLIGIYTKEEAIALARSDLKNLIQLSEVIENDETYAICTITEAKRYLYEQKKIKRVSKSQDTKEICIKTNIDLQDLVRKLELIVGYVTEGEIVMFTIRNHRRGNQNMEEFVSNFLNSQPKLENKIIRRTGREAKFYISRKKK